MRQTPPLVCKNGAGRRIKRIRECHRSLRVPILEAGLLVHTRLAFATLEVTPGLELVVLNVIRLGNLLVGHEHVAQNRSLARICGRHLGGRDMPALHNAGEFERRYFEPCTEVLGVLIWVGEQLKLLDSSDKLHRERLCHHAVAQALLKVPCLIRLLGVDIHTAALLREPVIRTVHNAPLHDIAERRQTGKNDSEVTSALRRGAFEQTIDVLQKHIARTSLKLQESIDLPP